MTHPATQNARLEVLGESEGALRLEVAGHLDTRTVGMVWSEWTRRAEAIEAGRVEMDARGVTYCDGGGVALLGSLEERIRSRGADFELANFPTEFRPILDMVREGAEGATKAAPTPPRGFVRSVGKKTVEFLTDTKRLIAYAGEVIVAVLVTAVNPRRMRWSDAFRAMQELGVNGLPVILLINFLLGLILAYQTASGFHQYGADAYMADMLGVSLTRELAPLMTAIMLAARSGSAFAAEIGTMKVNEEVDALTTMGLDPVRFLATPRMFAAVVMVPFLTVFGLAAGLVGGSIVWMTSLGLPLAMYQKRLLDAVSLGDFIGGLAKATVFGVLVAAIGCIRGMQTRGGAIAVGTSTTSSVVSGIIAIALTDMVFAVIFFYMDL